ncbi:murein biosynthesis integral membrane protein MurJ [Ktedonobacter robiniae]|uniref:murein biosynthesis integral membrane protein MurJ n=1 Tax=Ktedonobacter robiniae TaxID=2778365 RepID=UPI0019157833|nr:murein biosynthesis integral membrane protein MurJ [Ktedonobacter robiniae]
MENQGQQPSQPVQGSSEQQGNGFYGWQYDQDNTEIAGPRPPAAPLPPRQFAPPSQGGLPPSQGGIPTYPEPQSSPQAYIPHSLQQPPGAYPPPGPYQEQYVDMGSTLSYGQGMEYQYFDAPQPSQPIAQLRQERLQQLREERMRRQQRRMKADVTTIIPWRRNPPRPTPPPIPGSRPSFPDAPLPSGNNYSSVQAGPIAPPHSPLSLPGREETGRKSGLLGISQKLKTAGTSAQDTGMIQKAAIGRATMILTVAFVGSRVLGLLRTSMFAFVFGASNVSDAYLQAFLIPDLIFNVVAGGALSSAFIPVFTKHMVAENDEKTAWHIASSALNLAILGMVILAGLAILFAPGLVPLYNQGDAAHLALITSLTRIMLLQSIALGAGVITTSVLNARQNFRIPAIGTVLYNVGLIAGLLPGLLLAFLGKRNDTFAIYCATWGVVIGAVLQVGIQVPAIFKVGMQYSPKALDWRNPSIIQIARQMVPRIVNASMLSFTTFVDRSLIGLLAVGIVAANARGGTDGLISLYYQSMQLMLLPLGVFGMSVATAAFPTLAENFVKGRLDRVRNTIMETLRGILYMSIPSSVGLIVIGFPIIQVLLQHGRFNLEAAQTMTIPLAFFAFGLAGLAAVEILTRSFYALRDSKTPVIVSIGQFIFKIALALLLINIAVAANGGSSGATAWGLGVLAFSTSFAGLLEAIILFWLLHQRLGGFNLRDFGAFTGKVLGASVVMGAALLVLNFVISNLVFKWLGHFHFLAWLDTTATPSLGLLGTIVAMVKLAVFGFVALFVYVRVGRRIGIEELGPVRRVLDRLKLSWI